MSELTDFREEKDAFFQRHPQSPLSPDQKRGFTGLNYFPENDALRLEVTVEPLNDQQPMPEIGMLSVCRLAIVFHHWDGIAGAFIDTARHICQ